MYLKNYRPLHRWLSCAVMLFIATLVHANQPPIARAGTDLSATEGSVAQLSGSTSSDPESGPLQYRWEQLLGPTATLGNQNLSTLQVTLPTVDGKGGILTFLLTVTDNVGQVSTDTVDVNIQPVGSPVPLITTIAGGWPNQFTLVGTQANVQAPYDTINDSLGNTYISLQNQPIVLKLSTQGYISVFAGNGAASGSGDGGPATTISLGSPRGLAVDAQDNVYFADTAHFVVRKITPAGIISTVAGTYGLTGASGDGGLATEARLSTPVDIAFDALGNLYILDQVQNLVRKVDADGIISTVVQGIGLFQPTGLAADPVGNLYIADTRNDRVVRVTPAGIPSVFAGGGPGPSLGDNGPATLALLSQPTDVEVDAAGNLYIADNFNGRIRRVDTAGTITTVAGGGASLGDGGFAQAATLQQPFGVSVDAAGNLFIADTYHNRVRKVIPSDTISTVAGTGDLQFGGDQHLSTAASFYLPSSVALDATGNLYIADSLNNRIRKIAPNGIITTVAGSGLDCFDPPGGCGDGHDAKSARLRRPDGVAVDAAGNIYIADTYDHRVRKVLRNGTIETIAGDGSLTGFGQPEGIVVDPSGNVYVALNYIHQVVRITPSNVVEVVAGTGAPGFSGDGGPAEAAQLSYPTGLAIDSAGNLFVADNNNGRVRRIEASPPHLISTVAGGGPVNVVDGMLATAVSLASPDGITVDASGTLYVATDGGRFVRKIDPAGVITTITGTGAFAFSGDGGPASQAEVNGVRGMTLDTQGNLYLADSINNRIRRISGLPVADTTPPVISPTITGTLGTNGWYVSDVAVSWTVIDPESAIITQTGCDATTTVTDTAGTTLTCTATSGGGTATQSVTFKRDATAPTATAQALPVPNGEGWNNSDVTVSFAGIDALSGIANCTANALLTAEAANQASSPGTCTDNAGNVSASATVTGINIDKTAPVVTGIALPAPINGWVSGHVTVTFTGLDSLSGVAVGGCSIPVILTGNGSNQSAPGQCSDRAGNVGATVVTGINIDTSPPAAIATANPAPNANGWNNTDVTVTFDATDSLGGSGVASCAPPVILTAEGANQTASGSCLDVAGLTSNVATATVSIDKTPPSVAFSKPTHGDNYSPGDSILADYTCADANSGVAANGCTGTTASGAALDTAAAGFQNLSVTTSDRAGNTATKKNHYQITDATTQSHLIRVDYTFDINSTFGGFPGVMSFTGVAYYDLTAADTNPSSPDMGTYHLYSHYVTASGTAIVPAGNSVVGSFSDVTVQNQVPTVPPRDRFVLSSSFNYPVGDITITTVGFVLEGLDSNFSGDALLVPTVSGFSSRIGFVNHTRNVGGGLFGNQAVLTSLKFTPVEKPIPAPLAYYPLNGSGREGTGSNVNLTPLGTPTYVAARSPGLGQALSVNGVDQALVGSGFIPSGTGAVTLSAWVRAESRAANGSIFKNWDGQFHFGLNESGLLSNYIQLQGVGGQPSVTAPTIFPTGTWTHVAVVVNSATHEQRLFMNGSLVATAPFTGSLRSDPCPGLGIGVKSDCQGATAAITNVPGFWNGQIDEVAAWDSALSDQQIGKLYAMGQAGTPILETVPVDSTPPVIQPTVSGTLGQNSWYISDVQVSWSATDPDSAITTSNGCTASTVTTDTAGATFTCSATSAGGSSTQSVTVKRDTTPPTASAAPSPVPNGNGWNNSMVTVAFTGSDAVSGVAGCSASTTVTAEGANQSSGSGTCTDRAGNSSAPVNATGINIDKTPPLVSGVAVPLPGASGWNITPVTVSFAGIDALSGVSPGGCGAPILVNSNGANQSIPGQCSDLAGNIGVGTVSGLYIDTTPPVAVASHNPEPNANGWNNSAVTVSWAGTDAISGSGIFTCTSDIVLNVEGTNQSASGSCRDIAGLSSAPATAASINIDRTQPSVSVLSPVPNDGFVQGESPLANYSCEDVLSGIGNCSGTVPTGGVLNTASLGPQLVQFTATDRAGNLTSRPGTYSVNPPNTIIITTIAGTGASGFNGDGLPGTQAQLANPWGVALDSAGNLYISDLDNHRIRKLSRSGLLTTVVGTGINGFGGDGGLAINAQLSSPRGIAVDSAGNLLIADSGNRRIRKVAADGTISTVAGTGINGFSGDGGPALDAALNAPFGLAVDGANNVYFSDIGNSRIRKVSAGGIITTIAGTGAIGFSGDGGPATAATLSSPWGISVDTAQNIYFADSGNQRIRKITSNGVISTVAGNGTTAFSGDGGPATNAGIANPTAVFASNSGYLFVSDDNLRIRVVTPAGAISTLAGTSVGGYSGDGGPAANAGLGNPIGLTMDASGNLYVVTWANQHVRRIRDTTYTLAPMAVFGTQALNVSSAPQTVTLTVRGVLPVPVTSITLSGANPGLFSQTNNCGIQTQTAVSTTCTINVVFRPTSNGVKTAILTVNTSGGLGSKSVALSGTGGPSFSVSPSALAFGNQTVTTTSLAQTVAVTNTGSLALPITTIALAGGNANQFVQTTTCGTSVAVGSTCTVSVRFAPTTVGAKTTALNISAGAGIGTQSIAITGTATPPTFSLNVASLPFADQGINVSSSPLTVILTNTGPAALPITSINDSGTNANQFTESSNCGTSLAAGASCTINVVFRPTSIGAKTAMLNVNGGNGAGTQSVALTGNGISPVYSLSPGSLAFGNQARNTSSLAKSVTLSNTGALVLPVTGITLNGTNPGQFSQTNDCGTSVAVGASCTINVVFRPTTVGSKAANVRIALGGGATSPALVSLTGNGI